MIYLDPAIMAREVREELVGPVEIVRPVARDPLLARNFAELFACLTAAQPDRLASEEKLLRSLTCLLRRHGMARLAHCGPPPCVAKAIQRLICPGAHVFWPSWCGRWSRFQPAGFGREELRRMHTCSRRVCLARRLLEAGKRRPSHGMGSRIRVT
jgi:hypothetical protein